jgi:hypothetical protein
MSHDLAHIMEQIGQKPLFWLSYPQLKATLTQSLPTQKPL